MGEPALPERLPLPFLAPVERSYVADGVRPRLAPAHARPLEPLPHHRLARALHRPATYLPALRLVLGVLHPVHVVPEVALHPVTLLAQRPRLPLRPLPVAQHRQRRRPALLLQQAAPLPALLH